MISSPAAANLSSPIHSIPNQLSMSEKASELLLCMRSTVGLDVYNKLTFVPSCILNSKLMVYCILHVLHYITVLSHDQHDCYKVAKYLCT